MEHKPCVLITGAGNGLGKALASTFAENGFEVFAGDIAFSDASEHENILQLSLDITDNESIQTALLEIQNKTDQLAILINNAGISDNFPISESDPEMVFDMLNINTMGSLRVVHHFLPLLLKARGKIITISSESVRIPGAFQPYQVSKIALEGIHKTLRQELLIKGVRMIIIRPGAINTKLLSGVLELAPYDYLIFKKEFDNFRKIAPKYIGKVLEPGIVAQRIYKISRKKNPRYAYRINHDPVRKLIACLPEKLRDHLVKIRLTRF